MGPHARVRGPRRERAQAHETQGLILSDEQIKRLQRLLASEPGDLEARGQLIRALERAGRGDDALELEVKTHLRHRVERLSGNLDGLRDLELLALLPRPRWEPLAVWLDELLQQRWPDGDRDFRIWHYGSGLSGGAPGAVARNWGMMRLATGFTLTHCNEPGLYFEPDAPVAGLRSVSIQCYPEVEPFTWPAQLSTLEHLRLENVSCWAGLLTNPPFQSTLLGLEVRQAVMGEAGFLDWPAPQLARLVLVDCGLVGVGPNVEQQAPNLEVVDLSGSPDLSHHSLVNLLRLPHLTGLKLRSCGIDDHGARAIAAAVRRSRRPTHLDLRGNLITCEGARALANVASKRWSPATLDLADNRILRPTRAELAEQLEGRIPRLILEK